MDINGNIIAGLLTGRVECTLGCGQSKKLKEASRDASVSLGAVDPFGKPNGSVDVSAKLWNTAPRVKRLILDMANIRPAAQDMALPWVEKAIIFRVARAQEIKRRVDALMDGLTPRIDDIELNFDEEVRAAMAGYPGGAERDFYPLDGQDFRSGIVRKFVVSAVPSSSAIIQLLGEDVGTSLAAEREDDMRQNLAKSQAVVVARLHAAMERIVAACDPGKDRVRITQGLLGDMNELMDTVPNLLLIPDPKIEDLASDIRLAFSGISREDLAEDKGARASAHTLAKSFASTLAAII